jgi:hypothetical protein
MTLAEAKHDWWPVWLVDAVRNVRGVSAWASRHTLAGVPLDWIVRFALIGVLYLLVRRRLSRGVSAGVAIGALCAKELFDIVAHQNLLRPRAPDLGDLADVLSGLAGLAAAMAVDRMRRTSTRKEPETGTGG